MAKYKLRQDKTLVTGPGGFRQIAWLDKSQRESMRKDGLKVKVMRR